MYKQLMWLNTIKRNNPIKKKGFSEVSVVKNLPANAGYTGNMGSVPGSG